MEDVRSDTIRRADPDEFEHLRKEKYISGANESRPAVVSVNTLFASLGALELIARLNPYRHDPNSEFASYEMLITAACLNPQPESDRCPIVTRLAGRGDMQPFLDFPLLRSKEQAA